MASCVKLLGNPHDKTERLLKANPVFHDGQSICESLIIVQYIDDARNNGPSLLPSDPHDRALARFWAAYIDDKWIPLYKELKETSTEEARKEIIERICEGLILFDEAFVRCSKGKPFFGGDNIGYLDIALGSYMGWLKATEEINGRKFLDQHATPSLAQWAEKFYSHDAFKEVVPKTQKLVEIDKMVQGSGKPASGC
ncbi:glutathione S-transferase U17-like [Olea europaea subsp. europaea]|uniref:Glutathione S-transferase n=1 Tax=Olea europaea subsp. europaea TaxID=158383 RepID=A0A8S0VG96_OLEEU|nr:glutathione S-transferase U17-like [Olea europaea subsp. europaea]